jgi:membrane-associated phospholipid phosphatase
MSLRAPLALYPTRLDLEVAKASARVAKPENEAALRLVTWLADEKIVLTGSALFWILARSTRRDRKVIRQADHMLLCVAAAALLPHILKLLVRRRRPDRTVVHAPRHGIPRSGNAWDSFPSGHALHLGAAASPLRQVIPRAFRPIVWPSVLALSASRILLLAHYPTDVIAGLAIGVALEKAIARARGLASGGGRRDLASES